MIRLSAVALVVLLTIPHAVNAQGSAVRATRPDGSIVLLHPDGTWTEAPNKTSTTSSPVARTRPATASETVQLLKAASLSFDPAKWRQATSTTPGRFSFGHASGDGYAMVIAERIAMEPDALVAMALSNAREAAPDARLVLDEARTVNGAPVRCLQIVGKMQGITFKFFGYYYAGPAGTIQVITYTSEGLFDDFAADFQDLLDGLATTS